LHLVLLHYARPKAQRSISAVHSHRIDNKLCQPAKRISAQLAPWLLALSNPQHPPIVYVFQLICHHVIFRHSSYRHSVSYSSIFLTGYVHHQLQCTQQLQDYYQLFDCSTPICYCFDLSRICYYFVQSDRISFCYPMPHSSNAPSVFARPSDLLPSLCSSVSTRQEDLSSTGSMATSFVSPQAPYELSAEHSPITCTHFGT
jgi:hypothetical protein